MGHGIGASLMRNPHKMLRDQRPGDRGAQEIQPFIQRIGAEHGKHKVADEFFAHVDDVDVLCLNPHQQRLLARRFQFLALTQIGGKGNDLAAIFGLQPFQDDRGVQTARIGENDFLRLLHQRLHFSLRRDSGKRSPRQGKG